MPLPSFLAKGKISKTMFSPISPSTSLQRHMLKPLFIPIPSILHCPWNLTTHRQPLTTIMTLMNLKPFLPALNVPLEGQKSVVFKRTLKLQKLHRRKRKIVAVVTFLAIRNRLALPHFHNLTDNWMFGGTVFVDFQVCLEAYSSIYQN